MKRTMFLLGFATATGVALAVDFTGPGSDIADKANWGGTLPSTTTAVNYPSSKYPSGGFTLSDDVEFASTTIPTGYTSPALFDLNGHAYVNASGELKVNSSATFMNGVITNTTKRVGLSANVVFTVSGSKSVLRTVNGDVGVSAGSTLCVTNGAKFYPGGSATSINANNVTYLFTDKAEYDVSLMSTEYNLANIVQNTSGSRWCFDNARGTIYTLNWGGRSTGALGAVSDSSFEVLNGSDVFIGTTGSRPGGCAGNNGGGNSRGVWVGNSAKLGQLSVRNKFIVRDSTFRFETSQGTMFFSGSYDQMMVSNSTCTLYGGSSGAICVNGYTNIFQFVDSAFGSSSGSINLKDSSVSNRIEVANCSSFPAVGIAGTNNYVRVTSNLASQVALGGYSNTFEFVDGVLTKWPTMTGEHLTLDLNGGVHTNCAYTFSGTNRTIIVRNGGEICHRDYRNNVKFVMGATKDFTLRIDDGTFVSHQAINFNGNEVPTYNWTNCPNCAIEFSGTSPKFVMKCAGANYESLCLGTADEEPLTDAVRLRFIIGKGGYDEAPVQNLNPGKRCDWWIFGNQPIDIRLADGFKLTEKLRVPLFYDVRNFIAKPMNAARIAKLTANATFPDARKYKTKFVYVSADKTLYAEIRPITGFILVIR